MITHATADILLSIGSVIGLCAKFYALLDKETVWSRKSSGLNIVSYPLTALLPFYVLELWFTFTITLLNFMVWIGIFLFRNPET